MLPVAILISFATTAFGQSAGLPPAEAAAMQRLESSPRHGEWVTVDAGGGDKVDVWVVYPERSDRAPVVLVVHEIFGLSDWVRATADQLAAEGFIAVAPDLISGKAPGGKGSRSVSADAARSLIAGLDPAEVVRTARRHREIRDRSPRGAAALRRCRILLGRRRELRLRDRADRD